MMDALRTQSRHEDKAKKVGITFVKKSELNQYTNESRPKVFIHNQVNNFKPKVHDNQCNSKAYHNKSKTSNDKDRLAAIPTGEDVICFNCEEPGYYARDCKKPKWNKLHVRTAHTAIIDEENNDDQDNQLSAHSDQPSTGSQGYQSDEEEMVKVDVYDNNDWYDHVSDTEHMFVIGEID